MNNIPYILYKIKVKNLWCCLVLYFIFLFPVYIILMFYVKSSLESSTTSIISYLYNNKKLFQKNFTQYNVQRYRKRRCVDVDIIKNIICLKLCIVFNFLWIQVQKRLLHKTNLITVYRPYIY